MLAFHKLEVWRFMLNLGRLHVSINARIVTVKRELSQKAKFSIYQIVYIPIHEILAKAEKVRNASTQNEFPL